MASLSDTSNGSISLLSMNRSELIQAKIEVYRPLITRDVKAIELLSLMGSLVTREDKSRLRKLYKQGSEQCTDKLLDLINEKDTPGKWQVFLDALSKSGYENLCSALTDDGDMVNCEQQKQVVKLFSVTLRDKILPSTIMPDLIAKDVLSDADSDEILAEETQHGQSVSAVMLIHRISSKSKTWFTSFIEVLAKHGHREVAQMLENCDVVGPGDDAQVIMETESFMEIDKDDFIERKIENYRSLIIRDVNAMEIMNLIPSLKREQKMKLKKQGNENGMEMLLQMIKDQTDEPGKWTSVVDALNEAGYENLTNALTGGTLKDTEDQQKIINLFAKQLEDKLDPMELLPDLVAKKVLSDVDAEEIKAHGKNSGRNLGAITLIHLIPSKLPNWFNLFLEVLDKHGKRELVDLLDDGFYLKKKIKDIEGSSEEDGDDDDENRTMEDNASYSGEAYKSRANLYSAPGAETGGSENNDEMTRLKRNLGSESETEGTTTSIPMEHDESLEFQEQNNMKMETIKQNLEDVNKGMAEMFDLQPEPPQPYNIIYKRNSDMNSIVDNQPEPEEEPHQATKVLKLRDYQMELAIPGIQGKNCIVVAPTGSGKTHVALKIIQEHMIRTRHRRIPKVIFIVEQSALADQQSKRCMEYLNYRVKVITGEVQRSENFQELSQWVSRYDILVVTAQLLVNALIDKDIDITSFSLVVFDECHHADGKHPYNRIMHRYLDLKLDDYNVDTILPQVVGLTASVGCGKAKAMEGVVSWVETIMANLDAEDLATVKKCLGQLMQYVIVPEETKVTVPERKNKLFGQGVTNLMTTIEKIMLKSDYVKENPSWEVIRQAPAQKGSELYTGWVSRLWRETAQINDRTTLNFFRSCRNYLEIYNKALLIYADARVKDALEYLDREVKQILNYSMGSDIDNKLKTIYEKSKSVLENCMYSEDESNPKLDKLREMLSGSYRENPDSRGIVFVKTRDLAKAIVSWMKDTPGLKELDPISFVGQEAMTKSEQTDALELFRDGTHKIIIATSVAEEGLDIQACNLVIRYDFVTNEIARVQARGRGRAEGSQYVALVVEGGKAEKKEELNLMREAMMQSAIACVQRKLQENKAKFLEGLTNKQKLEKSARDKKATSEKAMREGEFSLRCGQCDAFICMSYEIRKIEDAHHAVIGEGVTRRIVATRCNENKFIYRDAKIQSGVGKITCKSCANDLGNVTVFKEVQFPVIKIKSFIIEDAYGSRVAKKKWNQVPFRRNQLSDEDLQRARVRDLLIEM